MLECGREASLGSSRLWGPSSALASLAANVGGWSRLGGGLGVPGRRVLCARRGQGPVDADETGRGSPSRPSCLGPPRPCPSLWRFYLKSETVDPKLPLQLGTCLPTCALSRRGRFWGRYDAGFSTRKLRSGQVTDGARVVQDTYDFPLPLLPVSRPLPTVLPLTAPKNQSPQGRWHRGREQ